MGSKEGGIKAAATLKARDPQYYKKIGAKGGANSGTGGFAWMKANGQTDKISVSGKLGGSVSRRGPSKLSLTERKVARLRHMVKHAELYKLSEQQVAKLSQKFGKAL